MPVGSYSSSDPTSAAGSKSGHAGPEVAGNLGRAAGSRVGLGSLSTDSAIGASGAEACHDDLLSAFETKSFFFLGGEPSEGELALGGGG